MVALLLMLVFDSLVSWLRMGIALVLSIIVGLAMGIVANRSSMAERVLLPLFDILQTLPILAFFPIVVYVVVAFLPGFIGINAAVILLIFTSMVWNIGFGAYEAIRTMPKEFAEVSEIFRLGQIAKLRKVLVPAAMPKVIEQSTLSWSVGLFYLVTSEIFSTGSKLYAVKYGIGSAIANYAFMGDIKAYLLGIIVLIAFVAITRLTLFSYLEKRFVKREVKHRKPTMLLRGIRNIGSDTEHRFTVAERILGKRIRAIERGEAHEAKRIQRIVRDGSYVLLGGLIAIVVAALALNPGIGASELQVLYAMAFSLGRIWLAFAVILVISIPLGIYILFMTKKGDAYMTLFQILAAIPATVLLPALAIGLKGTPYEGELIAMFIFFLSGFWYMLFGIVSTRASLQPSWEEAREVFGVKGKAAWKYFYLRAILPGLITGGITAIAAEWNASIVAEYFSTSGVGAGTALVSVGNGLGKLLDLSLASNNLWLMALGLINLTIVIIVINRLLWKRAYNRAVSVYK